MLARRRVYLRRCAHGFVAACLVAMASVTPAQDWDATVQYLRARKLMLPIATVSAAQLTDTFTQSRAAGRPHEALDIMVPRGTPVLAVEDGRIAKLFLSKPGGITLYQFDPHAEFAYYYAHLDRYADGMKEGIPVLKGQVIGYVGSTGNASPDAPHLHFAVFKLGAERLWWRGTALNPFLLWRD
jgi:murein DD-endopeptidase MepM/ murein hydrolase activator NlpD